MVPAALPELEITIGNQPLPEPFAVIAVRVDQQLNLPAYCELVMEPRSTDALTFASPGDDMKLRIGGPNGTLLFQGTVCAREITHAANAAPRLVLRGYDPLLELARSQRVRAHVGVSAADLLEELATVTNLRVSVDERGPVHSHVIQDRQTDLALCSDICQRAGLFFFATTGGLELFALSRAEPSWKPNSSERVLRLELSRSNTVAANVKTIGWHPRSNDVFMTEAAAVAETHGQRIHTSQALDDDAQVKAAARAAVERHQANASFMRALIADEPTLRPGVRVSFPDYVGADSSGYLVCRATHHVSAESGYVTEISSEPPSVSNENAATSLTIGIVSQLDNERMMAKIRYPAIENVETDWMKVVSPGGGAKTGLLFMPQLGDAVLVACAGADSSRGVILGGLIADDGPELPVTDGELAVQMRTRAGARIELSDANKTMRLEDPRGNRLVFDPDGINLFARGDLQIRAPGKTITIAAARIDFKKAEGDS